MSSHVSCKTTHLKEVETAGKLIDETLIAALTEVRLCHIYSINHFLTIKYVFQCRPAYLTREHALP